MPAARTLLILASKTGYQTRAFARAAEELGLAVAYGTDRCHVLDDPWGDRALPLQFEDPDASAHAIVRFAEGIAKDSQLAAIVALGDRATSTAARAAAALSRPGHPPTAADICRDKYQSRAVLRAAFQNQEGPGKPAASSKLTTREPQIGVPAFVRLPLYAGPACGRHARQQSLLAQVPFALPWVLKPLSLSGSRGVIRANDLVEAVAAFDRISAMLRTPGVLALREPASGFIQVEQYVGGVEVAVEALVERGRLQVLALFDKPDPLTGPYFEETIYVTPSRLSQAAQRQIEFALARAVAALGLHHGPVHAEMRIELEPESSSNGAAPNSANCFAARIWIMEVAARSIGGLCAGALRFDLDGKSEGETTSKSPAAKLFSLENLLVRLALGESVSAFRREACASGVMMVPIPASGIYQGVTGVERALALPGIAAVEITAKPGQQLIPLPEGASYLGFIFSRADTPAKTEAALRAAHAELHFQISPGLPVLAPKSSAAH